MSLSYMFMAPELLPSVYHNCKYNNCSNYLVNICFSHSFMSAMTAGNMHVLFTDISLETDTEPDT